MSNNAKSVSWKENGEEIALSDIINCEKLRQIANMYSGLIKLGLSDKQATLFMMARNSQGLFQSVPLEQPQPLEEKRVKSEKVKRKEKRILAKKQSKLKMTC